MSFLAEYDALAGLGQAPEQTARAQAELLTHHLLANPTETLAELRAHRPILDVPPPGPVVVTRFRDVVEVADLDTVFSVAPYGRTNAVVMGGANFLLGMENTAQYEFEKSVLRVAARRTDLEAIRAYVAETANGLVDAAGGELEVAEGLARRVPLLMVGHYFGVPGPDPATLGAWIRTMFIELFLNLNQSPEIAEAGAAAGRELSAHVDAQIAQAHAAAEPDDTVLARLVRLQSVPGSSLPDDRIRANLIGLLLGVIDNTTMAVCNTLDVLFRFPEQWEAAVAASRDDDPEKLLAFVLEALRFRSPAPLLVRLSTREHVLARGTAHEHAIAAGRVVYASNGSAMLDDGELDEPEAFRPGRPAYQYLHFGWGLHQCFGKYISQVQVTEIVRSVLVRPGLRRADGAAGELRYEGFFPHRFVLAFDGGEESPL